MDKMRLGRTGIMASKSGFGALPIQRVSFDEARLLLSNAYENGINFFDTARAYSDSEEKIGFALSSVRKNIFIATKSGAHDKKTLLEHLGQSLRTLKTDYIDLYQLHNPPQLPDYDDPDGMYQALVDARAKGLIRFIGVTNHRLSLALEAVNSDRFDTVQFPFSLLASERDLELVRVCREKDIGFIAMKAMSGGLITNPAAAFAYLRQFDNVLPIWGIQRVSELDDFLRLEKAPPALDGEIMRIIERDRLELSGSFCRGCGYCQPCPAGIPIDLAARMKFLLRRSPAKPWLTDDFKAKMERIENCTGCNHCRNNCPYGLDTPKILKEMLADYREFYAANT